MLKFGLFMKMFHVITDILLLKISLKYVVSGIFNGVTKKLVSFNVKFDV